MPNGTQSLSTGQTILAVGVVATLASVVAVKMTTAYVWRAIKDGFEGAWDLEDDDDDFDPVMRDEVWPGR